MNSYRLYFLNEAGRIQHAIAYLAETDEAAIAVARGHADGRAMELWSLDRVVTAFPRAGTA